MSDRLQMLREQRGKLVADMRSALAAPETEKRELTGEERTKYDEMFDKSAELKDDIAREERQIELDREEADEARKKDKSLRGTPAPAGQTENDDPDVREGRAVEIKWESRRGGAPDYIKALQENRSPLATPEYRKAFNSFLLNGQQNLHPDEQRALSAGTGSEGGYLKAPPVFIANLIKGVDDALWMRTLGTQIPVMGSDSIGVPTLDADPADADWTSELETGSADSSMAFGKRNMEGHPLAKRILISRKLLRNTALNAEALVTQKFIYKFGVTLEKAYQTGNGVDQPLGVFTASSDGIPTSRDISTDNSITALSFDGLISAKYSLKSQYWNSASWLFHRDVMKTVSKLKDNDGQYLWRISVREDEPDTILGRPVRMSEYAPSTMTSGQYVGMLADWSWYWYLDSMNFELQRLNELYAETNQIGYIGRYEGDGAPVLAEAFTRIKLA